MGIFNYHKLLQSNYPQSFHNIQNNNVFDNIYFDGNFLLHSCVHGTDNLNELLIKLHRILNVLFRNFLAKKKIYFALDGVAPMAKILLQRKRRQLSSGLALELIPGTNTMKKIEEFIQEYLQNLKYKYFQPQIITSFTNEQGEGEIKLFGEIKKTDGTHLIIGNDADIIVLASCINKPYINVLFKYPQQNIILSIDKLIHSIGINIGMDNMVSIKMNLAFISLMMGNDYLAKIKGISSEKLWTHFMDFMKKTKCDLITNGNLNKKNIEKLLFNLYTKSVKTKKTNMINFEKCKNYVDGIEWCINMYMNGKCIDNTYVYAFDSGPELLELFMYIVSSKKDIITTNIKYVNIPTNIYPILVLPYNGKNSIDSKLHSLMDTDFHYLYELELCEKCKHYKDINSELFADKSETGKEKYNTHIAKYIKHKKRHYEITIKDIYFILEKLRIKL